MSETPTPSARIISSAAKTKTITDANGRKIVFRTLNVLDQARIFKAIGAAHSENGPYVRIATIAASVMEIDGVPCPIPTNEAAVDAAIGRLGDEGYLALEAEAERMAAEAKQKAAEAIEAAASPVDAARNFPSTPA